MDDAQMAQDAAFLTDVVGPWMAQTGRSVVRMRDVLDGPIRALLQYVAFSLVRENPLWIHDAMQRHLEEELHVILSTAIASHIDWYLRHGAQSGEEPEQR